MIMSQNLKNLEQGKYYTVEDLRDQLKEANARNLLLEQEGAAMRIALDNISGFGNNDMTFNELSGYVNETCNEVLKSTTLGEKFLEEVEFLKCERDNALALVGSYDRQDEVIGPEFEGVENVTEVIALLKEQVTTTQKKLAAVIALIKKEEWKMFSNYYECAYCGKREHKIHRPNCSLAAILKDEDASGWVHVDTIVASLVRNFRNEEAVTIAEFIKTEFTRSTSTQGT